MANIVTLTEQFDNTGVWSVFDGATVTADSFAAPEFAGLSANDADTLTDTGASQSSVFGTYQTIPNDASDWVTSIFIRKDGATTRFPEIGCQFAGGTGITASLSVNTSSGAVANGVDGAPDASGVVDVDANWWRVWFRKANNNSGNTVLRVYIFPARASTLGGGADGSVTGSIVAWGVNQTNHSTLQGYEPDPFYLFPSGWETIDTLGSTASSYSDLTVEGGVEYDYRILAENAVGTSPSNIVTATASPDVGGVTLPRLERSRRGMFRGVR